MKFSAWRTLDWSLYVLPVFLVCIGIATIYSTTLGTNIANLVSNQLMSVVVGIILMVTFSVYDYRNLRNFSKFIYITSVVLLVLVFFLGKKILGATRWIDLGIIQLQPSEITKVGLLLYMSTIFCGTTKYWLKNLIWVFLVTLFPLLLIVSQPDLGTAIVTVLMVLNLFFTWDISRKVKVIAVIILIALVPLGWMSLKSYQRERLKIFVDPGHDPRGTGYNVIQSEIAVGSGGVSGRGLGNGPQSQLNFLPVAQSDFIFAGWSEATGFIGATALVVIELLLCWRVYRIATIARDSFGQYLAVGFGTMLFAQSAINVGMNIGLAPVTGIPLPFVSYGGTSLLANFLLIGVIQSVYIRFRRSSGV